MSASQQGPIWTGLWFRDVLDFLLHEGSQISPIRKDLVLFNVTFCHQFVFTENLGANTSVNLNLQHVGRKHYFPCDIYGLIQKSEAKEFFCINTMYTHTKSPEVPIKTSIHHSLINSFNTYLSCFEIEIYIICNSSFNFPVKLEYR